MLRQKTTQFWLDHLILNKLLPSLEGHILSHSLTVLIFGYVFSLLQERRKHYACAAVSLNYITNN